MPTRGTQGRRTGRANNNHVAELRGQAVRMGRDVQGLAATAGAVARDQLDPIESYVQAHPLKSMLIAAGVGALFSFVFLRR